MQVEVKVSRHLVSYPAAAKSRYSTYIRFCSITDFFSPSYSRPHFVSNDNTAVLVSRFYVRAFSNENEGRYFPRASKKNSLSSFIQPLI